MAAAEEFRGAHTHLGRGSHPGHTQGACGALLDPLRLSFGLHVYPDKIGASVNFRSIPRIFPG